MIAKEASLLKFLNGTKQFVIPIYQRTYSWNLSQCEQLWNDILKSIEIENQGYFIGSIVYVEKGLYQISAVPQLLVIDGQQRLTTISLLLLALSRKIKSLNKGDINERKILNYYLLNAEESGDSHYKLVLTQSDKQTFINLLEGKELPGNASPRIKENFEFFEREISVMEDPEKLYEGISKLLIIDVALDRERDNPQLIFESLNSTGLELSQADLIRNYILMGLERQEQEDLYQNYWHRMEEHFGRSGYSDSFDSFMRDFLTLKTGKIPNIRDVYASFKLYAQNTISVHDVVKEIYKYSKYYVRMALLKEDDKELLKIFYDITALRVDVSYPFIMEVYEDFENKVINKDEFVQILQIVESYVFRRAICGIPTNSLNKTFAYLIKEITKEKYIESCKAALLLNDSYKRFPLDNEFKKELMLKDVYNFRNRNYLLRKLENHDRKETVDIETYTIEHIMPQNENLSQVWRKELGPDWERVHDELLHTLGNLTLTGYNSELSDRSFKEKKKMKGGFADSPIRLNRDLATIDQWNETAILERARKLTDMAVNVWQGIDLPKETLEQYKEVAGKTSSRLYSLEDHKYLDEPATKELFEELRKRILNLDSSVREEILKLYIAYKTTTNFVDIIPHKKELVLSLNINFDEINDPKGICEDVTDKGRWGNGNVRVRLTSLKEIDYIMSLIRQAYEKRTEEESDDELDGQTEYDLDYVKSMMDKDIFSIFLDFRKKILALDEDMVERVNKRFIGYKVGPFYFVTVHLRKKSFHVHLKFETIALFPENFERKAGQKGDMLIKVESGDDITPLVKEIQRYIGIKK